MAAPGPLWPGKHDAFVSAWSATQTCEQTILLAYVTRTSTHTPLLGIESASKALLNSSSMMHRFPSNGVGLAGRCVGRQVSAKDDPFWPSSCNRYQWKAQWPTNVGLKEWYSLGHTRHACLLSCGNWSWQDRGHESPPICPVSHRLQRIKTREPFSGTIRGLFSVDETFARLRCGHSTAR